MATTKKNKKKTPKLPPRPRLDPEEQRALRERLMREQGTGPIDFEQFRKEAKKVWPKGESVGEFVATLRELRRLRNGNKRK